jgi:hypothetical protein
VRGIVLVSIDALRADRLGPWAAQRTGPPATRAESSTPFLDELARRAVVFDNAFAQVPSTLPSHMSMFTGLYPSEHTVYPPSSVLAAAIPTLPEVLRRAGFRTFGHSEGGYVQGGYGFSRGFEEWTDTPYAADTDVERTFGRGLDSLAKVAPGERFFLFLHSYTVHDPYEPPETYRRMYWPDVPPPGAFAPIGPNFAAFNGSLLDATPAAIGYYSALYDAGVRYLDDVVARLFAGLERLGLAGETLVIFTADHGEEFAEHGHLVHTQAYPECLRIPLLAVLPGAPPGRVARVVETVDFAPTIYELAGVAAPPALSGESVAAALRQTGPPRALAGSSYGENVLMGFQERTIFQAVGGRMFQLYRAHAEQEEDGFWVTRRVRFDARPPRISFRAVAFPEPRRVVARTGGRELATLELGKDWKSFRLDLPASAPKARIELATEGCTAPLAAGLGGDGRCLSFKIHGPQLERLELFDLAADRAATRDLSIERPDLTRTLSAALKRYPEVPRARSSQSELSEEQVRQLKALGYL